MGERIFGGGSSPEKRPFGRRRVEPEAEESPAVETEAEESSAVAELKRAIADVDRRIEEIVVFHADSNSGRSSLDAPAIPLKQMKAEYEAALSADNAARLRQRIEELRESGLQDDELAPLERRARELGGAA